MNRLLAFTLLPLLGVTLLAAPARAAFSPRGLRHLQLTYDGGPLLQHPQVATLFWGPDWKGSSLAGYFDGFFQALFADGRFMANLGQYSAGNYQIGAGTFAGTTTDDQAPPATVQDADIRGEIRAEIAAGHLPAPTPDTVYFVFTPPQTVVVDQYGNNSVDDFVSYHDYAAASDGFAYAVVPYDDTLQDPRLMTIYASHELAEAVTDPQPSATTLGWYNNSYGEVGDIPVSLFAAGRIGIAGLIDILDAPDGTVYLVQKVWSNQSNLPVAFAAAG